MAKIGRPRAEVVMTDEERAELEAGLAESIDDMRAGRTVDGPEFLAKLRARG